MSWQFSITHIGKELIDQHMTQRVRSASHWNDIGMAGQPSKSFHVFSTGVGR